MLKRYALGYRFETDVVRIKFITPDLVDYNYSISVLHGLLRGVSRYLDIEQNNISGCLQYFYNEMTRVPITNWFYTIERRVAQDMSGGSIVIPCWKMYWKRR